jgi:hypothetical protein
MDKRNDTIHGNCIPSANRLNSCTSKAHGHFSRNRAIT